MQRLQQTGQRRRVARADSPQNGLYPPGIQTSFALDPITICHIAPTLITPTLAKAVSGKQGASGKFTQSQKDDRLPRSQGGT